MEFMGKDITNLIVAVLAAALVLAIAALILVILQMSKLKKQTKRLDTFMEGAQGLNIEENLKDKFARLNAVEERQTLSERHIKKIYKTLEGTYQKTGIVKYDAYSENGGKLSFALALLDESDNGFVMNVMTGRDGSYCYVKSVTAGESEIKLGGEEAKALAKALQQKKQ